MAMQTLISVLLGNVGSIISGVQCVTAHRQLCNLLASNLQIMQPCLQDVLEQTRSKQRGQKLFSDEDVMAFHSLDTAIDTVNRIIKYLKNNTNQTHMELRATDLMNDLSDVCNDISVFFGRMSQMTGLQITADMKASLEAAKDSLANLHNVVKEESKTCGAQLKKLEHEILDVSCNKSLLPTAWKRKEKLLQILASHFRHLSLDTVKSDLQGLSKLDCEWRTTLKKAP